jgi:hypothetical protein
MIYRYAFQQGCSSIALVLAAGKWRSPGQLAACAGLNIGHRYRDPPPRTQLSYQDDGSGHGYRSGTLTGDAESTTGTSIMINAANQGQSIPPILP